jgi:fluoroquinolone transport system permease protein
MNTLRAIRALGPIDIQNIQRDALLRWIVLVPLLIGLVGRYLVPYAAGQILARLRFDITPYYPLVSGFLVMTMPLMVGIVIGFLLLDQRDDHTLSALQVTPLSLNGYLIYRISLPMFLSFVTSAAIVPLSGLVQMNWLSLCVTALAAAPLAPIYALFFAAFAENKVQGFALAKAAGVMLLPPLIAYFVHSHWQWVFGLAPTYWPARLFWALQAGEPLAALYLIIGLLYQAALLTLLLRRFNRVAGV